MKQENKFGMKPNLMRVAKELAKYDESEKITVVLISLLKTNNGGPLYVSEL